MNYEADFDHDSYRQNTDIFLPGNERAYQVWREKRLATHTSCGNSNIIEISHLLHPEKSEIGDIISQCCNTNLAIYHLKNSVIPHNDQQRGSLRSGLGNLCRHLGLHEAEIHRSQGEDGVVAIEVKGDGVGAGYIPYSDRPLSWHTDGYYNEPNRRIKAVVLHCVRDAVEGGENEFLDPQIAYIRLRDANRALIEALMDERAMIIPENTDSRSAYRAASAGPVFFLDALTGALNMRYSARSRNIIWRDDKHTTVARSMLGEIMSDDPHILRLKLKPGQGVISNNVLHNRAGFSCREDKQNEKSGRLIYRIRYMNRVGEGLASELS